MNDAKIFIAFLSAIFPKIKSIYLLDRKKTIKRILKNERNEY